MNDIKKLLAGELIGRKVVLEKKSDGRLIDGKIIDETKNTIIIKINDERKRLVKPLYKFGFIVGDKRIVIDGKLLNKRPEERIKNKLM
jgi:RNase P/RNase MRP subunit p29